MIIELNEEEQVYVGTTTDDGLEAVVSMRLRSDIIIIGAMHPIEWAGAYEYQRRFWGTDREDPGDRE